MARADSQEEVIAFLSRPETYGLSGPVERHETHVSIVFLAGDCAYKLKRAVRYRYLDYSSPERRRAMCEAELKINRRTAPELYLDVRPIVRDDARLRWGAMEDAQAADWVVVMRRFAQEELLEQLRKRGRLTEPLIRELAEIVAGFHAVAEVRRDYGGAAAMARVIEENNAILLSMSGRPFAAEKVELLSKRAKERLAAIAPLLDQRREHGFVRRCHGDLHLNNICLVSGRPVLFDAIEFNDDFACIDLFYDLAFLLMDLDRHGLRQLANVCLNRYLEKTADYEGVATLPLFLACREAVRAHVTVTTAETLAGERACLHGQAVRLLDAALLDLARAPVRAIAVGGVSGTGKSALARGLAPKLGHAPGAVVIRSDVLRKRLCGVAESIRLPASAYTSEMHERVYAEVRRIAATLLAAGHSVILDAVHGRAEERGAIEDIARRSGAQFTGLWLQAPDEILEARLAARKGDASDATVEVMRAQLQNVSVPEGWTKLDASRPFAGLRADCEAVLRSP